MIYFVIFLQYAIHFMCEQRYDFMENFYISLNAVLPMFIILFIGFAIRKLNVLKESFLPRLNKLVFTVFFPFLMFNNIFGSDFSSVFNFSRPRLLLSLLSYEQSREDALAERRLNRFLSDSRLYL